MKISTLGPPGTFSDQAAKKFATSLTCEYEIQYFDSISLALDVLEDSDGPTVIPIENFSEGSIPTVLDFLAVADVEIINELYLPIRFSCASASPHLSYIEDCDELYVQYMAKGQCSKFIRNLTQARIINTDSNIESLELAIAKKGKSAAIIPSNTLPFDKFRIVQHEVNDFEDNLTRFLVLSRTGIFPGYSDLRSPFCSAPEYKTSIVMVDDNDRPGLLHAALSCFASRHINLTSITSRPSLTKFGRYHFFIDIEGNLRTDEVLNAVNEMKSINQVKVLGCFPKAQKDT